jgi:endonuclease-3
MPHSAATALRVVLAGIFLWNFTTRRHVPVLGSKRKPNSLSGSGNAGPPGPTASNVWTSCIVFTVSTPRASPLLAGIELDFCLDPSTHEEFESIAVSTLTLRVMGLPTGGRKSPWKARLGIATDRLVTAYGTPTLGNFRNPVKEIFYILLSARTTENLYQKAHANLFSRFTTVAQIAAAARDDVQQCVEVAGFGAKRATHIIRIARQLIDELGQRPDLRLRHLTPPDAFDYLTQLSGVGPKSALCVMMCSLDHDVFPVDINVQRVFERLGVIRSGLPHYRAQQIAPRHVLDGASKRLHVGLVEHGRRVCVPRNPKCGECILHDMCRLGQKRQRLLAISA